MTSQIEAHKIATEFLDANTDKYLNLLEIARKATEEARKDCGEDVVLRVYSRKDKQKTTELKTKSKIIGKLLEGLLENPSYQINSMGDVIGLTVVVYYDDQIPFFIEKLVEHATKLKLEFENYKNKDGTLSLTKIHREKGYHATHLKVKSKTPALKHLRMEIQVKTMLHDAWGAKMHDLVYKPTGQLDPKLRQLMESFGDSIQAIEVQSETLRDAIVGRVRLLRQRRRAALVQLMAKLESQAFPESHTQEAFKECFQLIRNDRARLAICSSEDNLIMDVLSRIADLEGHGADTFVRLKLSVYVASLRDDTDLSPVVDEALQSWKDDQHPPRELSLFVTSASLHQTNRVAEAIQAIRNGLPGLQGGPITERVKLNLANYLIESNLDSLNPEDRIEVTQILHGLQQTSNPPLEGALLSTLAADKIVFGDETELDQGLSMCNDAAKIVDESGAGYCELYLTYGWQRKLRS